MNDKQWNIFSSFREHYRAQCNEWNDKYSSVLLQLQAEAANYNKTPSYPHETAVVYNTAYDDITKDSIIKYIVIGDNPGKDEQLEKNRKYLVGQAGKLAQGFFAKNDCFQTDFRKNVIILNKTPVHSAKTNQLKYIAKKGGQSIQNLLLDSQIWMAQQTAKLHIDLCLASDNESVAPELWLVGYSELKENGIFVPYKQALKELYTQNIDSIALWTKVFVFQHFSMNRFTIDLQTFMKLHSTMDITDAVHALGHLHKGEIYASHTDGAKKLVQRQFSKKD